MICLLSFTSAPLISHCVGRFHCCWEIDMAEKLCMYKRAEKPERKKDKKRRNQPSTHSNLQRYSQHPNSLWSHSLCLGVTGDKRWKFMFHNFLYTCTVHTTTKKNHSVSGLSTYIYYSSMFYLVVVARSTFHFFALAATGSCSALLLLSSLMLLHNSCAPLCTVVCIRQALVSRCDHFFAVVVIVVQAKRIYQID